LHLIRNSFSSREFDARFFTPFSRLCDWRKEMVRSAFNGGCGRILSHARRGRDALASVHAANRTGLC
jgi:hypothetical protein